MPNDKKPPDGRNPSDVRFGAALMRQRKKQGRTQKWLADQLGCSPEHIGNVENGRCPLNVARVDKADYFLQARSALARQYAELYQPETVDWLDEFHSLQKSAHFIREYHSTLVPAAFQNADYARAVIKASAPWFSSATVDERVELRESQGREVLKDDTPYYHVVLDDAVVLRSVAFPKVMADQFVRLAELMESGRIMLQVYSWERLPQLGLGGPFSLLSSGNAPDVLYAESLYLGQTTDDPGRVRQYGMLFSELQARARSPGATIDLLRKKAEEFR
ncbi:helix-turn-helix transcriptional regulator [Nocardiopsis exhalans]|uniref:Helix-turn-helix transcriptional regulator n=1 Tax=Nocardiopsis exhalans TaxID=163604 RepID=A0ABY5D839_9ACTN|nr:helix-turn-helix transcriptional regulator [Nocardiopsis exhalans]USY19332.1 helix-turn-helix transcriptional regulator [Nocardiopsis exhalans]